MSLLQPSGKRKHIQAQGMDQYDVTDSFFQEGTPEQVNPSQGLGRELDSLFDQESAIQDKEEEVGSEPEMGSNSSSDSDILEYIVKKLQSFGYPPRRLNEFKDDFIEEKILPGSARDVTVVFPDKYYGKPGRLSGKEVSKIIEEVQNQFGLTLKDGVRKEKKLILNFTSQRPEGEDEDNIVGDDLDEIFGGGTKKADPKKKRVAETQSEMMKLSMLSAFDKLNKRG